MGTRPATSSGDAASSAAEILHRSNIALARLGRRITGDAVAAGATGFTENNDVQVLLTLRLEGPCSPGRLTEAASMTSGGTTALLDRLERSGLLGRHRDPSASDRRTLDIVLTGEGERVADVLAEATRTALAIRAPEILDLLASLEIGRPSNARLPDVEGAAWLMLELASRSAEHTRAIHAAAAAAGGRDATPRAWRRRRRSLPTRRS
jgi:DNA-binding MarR family transcriptional regulator